MTNFTDAVVAVTGGRHKGRVGYCDSDEGDECFVYFGSWGDGYSVVKAKHLRAATQSEKASYVGTYQASPERWYARTADLGH